MPLRVSPFPPAILIFLCGMAAAQPLTTPRLSCEVENTAASTILTAKVKDGGDPIVFRIDWNTDSEQVENFKNQPVKKNSLTSTHRIGETTFTRTILAGKADDCIFIHVLANQPGLVNFTARFISEKPAAIQDRRQIVLSGKTPNAHAWIIPFESDVHDDAKGTIFLNGEGEALIILNLTADPVAHPISDTLTRLGEKYDPGHTPPSPHLIWEGIEEERESRRAVEEKKK